MTNAAPAAVNRSEQREFCYLDWWSRDDGSIHWAYAPSGRYDVLTDTERRNWILIFHKGASGPQLLAVMKELSEAKYLAELHLAR